MSEVYFSHQDGHYPPHLPTCDYMDCSSTYDWKRVRLDDKKKIQMYKDLGYYLDERNCGIHYFDETGYPQCKICGWTP